MKRNTGRLSETPGLLFRRAPGVAAVVLLGVLWGGAGMNVACAEVIPPERLIEWRPGVEGGIPEVPVEADVLEHGAAGDGVTDDAPAFRRAIASIEPPGAVLVPAGSYLLRSGLSPPSGVVLRGEGAHRSHLVFDAPDSRRPAIGMQGSWDGAARPVDGAVAAGARYVGLADTDGLAPGQMVYLSRQNDPDVMYTRPEWNTGWARRSVGRMLRVEAVEAGGVRLDAPLRLPYAAEFRPELRVVRPIVHAGLEGLHIRRLDHAEAQIVAIRMAENCWIRNCELDHCYRSHVYGSLSRFVTVEGNYMHHAWNYGGGGHGYGVNLSRAACDWLVTNNIFRSLRHSMLVQVGANGNVFSYNYSYEHRMCDISVHGHYPYMNLFEGNVVQWTIVGDWWGPAGPLTTLYRNRVVAEPNWGAGAVRVADHSHRTTVVGNTLERGAIAVQDSCQDCHVAANLVRGHVEWGEAAPGVHLPASLYLDRPPPFWGDRPWPCIGADVDSEGRGRPIPAQERAPYWSAAQTPWASPHAHRRRPGCRLGCSESTPDQAEVPARASRTDFPGGHSPLREGRPGRDRDGRFALLFDG
jgi:hypothetical protein